MTGECAFAGAIGAQAAGDAAASGHGGSVAAPLPRLKAGQSRLRQRSGGGFDSEGGARIVPRPGKIKGEKRANGATDDAFLVTAVGFGHNYLRDTSS